MRRAAKVDSNHLAVASTLRAIGATVVSLASQGSGVPDLLVGYGGVTTLLEVKSPGQSKRKGTTAERQALWRARWRGGAVAVVESPEEAVACVQRAARAS